MLDIFAASQAVISSRGLIDCLIDTLFFLYKNQENRREAQCSYFEPVFQPQNVLNVFLL